MIRTVIVDDEPILRRKLRTLITAEHGFEVAGESGDGPSAVHNINMMKPDAVFLDIQMPVFNGIEVARRITHDPLIIFVTAYDRYAITAFELQAVDYLLKPFDSNRFRKTLSRVRDTLTTSPRPDPVHLDQRMRGIPGPDDPLQRLFVRTGDRVTPLPLEKVLWFEARDDYVAVHSEGGSKHIASVRMADLEEHLDPSQFVRIHRSAIVNLNHVVSFTTDQSGRLRVCLSDSRVIFASRARSRALRTRIR